jgi:hypothetical protein
LRTFAQKRNGHYRVVLGSDARSLTPYETWSGVPASVLGYDFENAQTILSFGAPLLDGWGAPGRFTRFWAERAAGMADPQLRLIQAESSLSRTAARAWQWIQVHDGAESALAAGLARVLLEEHLVSAKGPMPPLTLAQAADQTGLASDAIRDLARTLVARPPVVAIASDDNPAIAALNVVLGATRARGGIVQRSKRSEANVSADAVIENARAVLIDSTVPWDFVPHTDAEVFRFAAWDGGSSKSDWLLPAPGFLEEHTDVPAAPTSAVETYAIAPALTKAPADVQSAAQFLASGDSTLPAPDSIIQSRCEAIFRARAGGLCGLETTPVAKIASVQKFEEQLSKGDVWVAEAPHPESLRCVLKEWPTPTGPSSLEDWSTSWRAPVLPPLATKLYRESSLRKPPERRNA